MSGRLALFRGQDAVLLADAVSAAVNDAVGDAERSEVLDDFRGEDYEPGEVALACGTVSMFGGRVVVARDLQRFDAEQLAPVLAAIVDLPDDVDVVLVWEGKPASRRKTEPLTVLVAAVESAGGVVTLCDAPSGKAAGAWLAEQVGASSVQLSGRAREFVTARLGEDVARIRDVLSALEATYGPGAGPLDVEEVEPFVGESGGVPPWELTDAIDRGDVAVAVTRARRMVIGGGRHPLQVLATLHNHFERVARLEGSGARDERAAATVLGLKGSTFPAKKALSVAQRLGPDGVRRAFGLIARADVDLRGRSGLDAGAVLEVLVARLAVARSGSARVNATPPG
ncbi:MAG: hypothetical protein FJW94_12330 [Actinobacteria bacterium]|nr:hypothetical protein [Actinomycetota bacterium]